MNKINNNVGFLQYIVVLCPSETPTMISALRYFPLMLFLTVPAVFGTENYLSILLVTICAASAIWLFKARKYIELTPKNLLNAWKLPPVKNG